MASQKKTFNEIEGVTIKTIQNEVQKGKSEAENKNKQPRRTVGQLQIAKLGENNKCTHPRSSMNPKHNKNKENRPKAHHNQVG